MRIGLFEQQMTRIIPSFAGFTEFTSSIPKLYWDVKSQEQRILAICKMLNKVICYADMLGENVDEIAKTLQDIEDGKLDPMIEAAIAQWFEDNQPAIVADVAALQAALPIADYDATHTVSDAIATGDAAINAVIGNGFDSDNTVANAINDIADEIGNGFDSSHTIADAISANADDIAKIKLKNVSFPAFDIVDRFIVDETPNTAATTGGQVGIVFNQDNNVYSATFINLNNSGGCDHIRIRDVNADVTLIDYPISMCHGLALDYNPQHKKLLWYDENTKSIYLLDMSTPSNPVANGVISTVGTNMQYGVAWYGATEFIMYYVDNNNHFAEIRDSSMNLVKTIPLTINTQPFSYQDMTCIKSKDILFIATSNPEMIIVVNLETGKQINVININRHYGHVIVNEIEGVSYYRDNIVFSCVMNVDEVTVITLFQWNYVDGNSKADESIRLWGSSDIVGTLIIDYENGSLRDPIGDNARTFKLAGDAENFAKMNYPDQAAAIRFANDYPLQVHMSAFAATVNVEGHSYPEGMKFDYMSQLYLEFGTGCKTGKEFIFQYSNVHLRGANNLTAIDGYTGNLWFMQTCVVDCNTGIDKLEGQYTRLIGASKPTNSSAWRCVWETTANDWN